MPLETKLSSFGVTLLVISTAFAESIIIKARICLHGLPFRADIYCDRKRREKKCVKWEGENILEIYYPTNLIFKGRRRKNCSGGKLNFSMNNVSEVSWECTK